MIKNIIRKYIKYFPIPVNGHWLYWHPKNVELIPPVVLGKYEKPDTLLFSSLIKPGWKIIDVGAYIGYYTTLFSKLAGKNGQVYSFEPNPETYVLLKKNTKFQKLKNTHLFNFALGNRNSHVEIFSPSNSAPDTKVSFGDNSPKDQKFKVLQKQLDVVLKGKKVDLIKMDVQGYELYVLKGALKTIKSNPNIILHLEFWPEGLRIGKTQPTELLNFVENLGFKIHLVKEGHTEPVINKSDLIKKAEKNFVDIVCFPNKKIRLS